MTKSDMEFRGRHEWIADMLCGDDQCYISVEDNGSEMQVCISGDSNKLLIGLIRIAERIAENCGMPCGAWASLMAAADVAKMLEEEENV